MADFPHPWGVYARLQKNLRNNYSVGDYSWGAEAGMDHILRSAPTFPITEDDVDHIVANRRRQERYRASRRDPLPEDLASPHPENALSARSELAAIRRSVGDRNWELLQAVAEGSTYRELSQATSLTPGAIRVKVLRLRTSLAAA